MRVRHQGQLLRGWGIRLEPMLFQGWALGHRESEEN